MPPPPNTSVPMAVGELPSYPPRPWYRRVPFISTEPRAPLSNFANPTISPEAKANILSKLTFSWLNGLLTVGYTRPLAPDDLYCLQDDILAEQYADRLEAAWERQVARANAINAAYAAKHGVAPGKLEQGEKMGSATPPPRASIWRRLRRRAFRPQYQQSYSIRVGDGYRRKGAPGTNWPTRKSAWVLAPAPPLLRRYRSHGPRRCGTRRRGCRR